MSDVPVLEGLAVLLAVFAVATVAAGFVGSATGGTGRASDAGFGLGEGDGSGIGDGDESGVSAQADPGSDESVSALFRWFFLALGSLAVAALLAAVALVLYRDGLAGLLELLRSVLGSVVGAVLILLALLVLLRVLSGLQGDGGGGTLGDGSVPEALTGQGATTGGAPTLDPLLALVAVGGLVVVAVVVLLTTDAVDAARSYVAAAEPGDRDDDAGTAATAPFRRTATDVEPTNAVYRAWLELAGTVDGRTRRTSTPGEVARAAVAGGYDRDAVRTVTELFAEVRYGGRPVDEERAARARSAMAALDDDRRSPDDEA